MKKIIALVLALSILFSLSACSKRPAASPDAPKSEAEQNIPETENPDEGRINEPEETPSAAPETTPEAQPEASPDVSGEPVESPEPSEEPEKEPENEPEKDPSEEPVENANDGKVDTSATVATTATDLAPGDSSFLALIPELPYENWASTGVDDNTIMLELKGLGSDAVNALLEYIEELREKDFHVTEYIYGSLYDAEKSGVTVSLMLDGGTFTVTIKKT